MNALHNLNPPHLNKLFFTKRWVFHRTLLSLPPLLKKGNGHVAELVDAPL
jgi:hypothetical protein